LTPINRKRRQFRQLYSRIGRNFQYVTVLKSSFFVVNVMLVAEPSPCASQV
jgi:hypothetical protein